MKRTALIIVSLFSHAILFAQSTVSDTGELAPVEVRATRASTKAPFAKTNLDKRSIEAQNLGQDLPFILAQTPSTVVSSDAGNGVGYTGIRIRGTDLTRINVTLNGIPYNDAESQSVYFVDLPDFASSLGSIQVQRGVGTSSNGSGAFGATINLSTNELRKEAYAESFNTYGSFNTLRNTIKLGTGLLNDHFTVDARLSRISSDGFIDRASSKLHSFYLSGAWTGNRSSIRMNVFSGNEKTFQAWNGVPEHRLFYNKDSLLNHYYNNLGSLYFTTADSLNLFNANSRTYNGYLYNNQTDNYRQDHYQLFFNHNTKTGIALSTGLFLTHGEGYYEEYKYNQRFSAYGLPNDTVGATVFRRTDLVRQLWLKNDLYGITFSADYKKKDYELTFGGSLSRFDGLHYGRITWAQRAIAKDHEWYRYPSQKDDGNIYGKIGYNLSPKWFVMGDLQYRFVRHEVRGTRKFPQLNVERHFSFFNPKAGLRYLGKDVTAFISYALGQKEPNRTDYETAADNKPPMREQLHDVEAGVEHKGTAASIGLNAYYMLYKDQLVLTGKLNDVGDAVRINVPESYRLGLEAWGAYKISDRVTVNANVTASRNRLQQYTDYIPRYDVNFDFTGYDTVSLRHTEISFSPWLTAAGTLTITPLKGLQLSFIGKGVSKQYLDNTASKDKMIRGYYVQDAELRYSTPLKFAKAVETFVRVNNIFGKEYESNGYTYSYRYDVTTIRENFYYPAAGVNVLAGINVKF